MTVQQNIALLRTDTRSLHRVQRVLRTMIWLGLFSILIIITAILAAIAGRAMGEDERDRLEFMRRELFLPLGMKTVVPEFDSAGQFMGGGFVHASAEDWARFGYLYLRDGIWEDRRILPEGWVDYSRTPAPVENSGVHGAHLWVNAPPAEGQWKLVPGAPASAFSAEGSELQVVIMVPTHDLLVVRLGVVRLHQNGQLLVGRLLFVPLCHGRQLLVGRLIIGRLHHNR